MSEIDRNQHEEEYGDADIIYSLVADIEEIANRYEQSYADGESGVFKLSKEIEDAEGLVTTKMMVKAQRIYSEDEQILTNYTVAMSTRYNNLTVKSFPDDIWEIISHDSIINVNDDDEDLEPHYVPDEEWLDTLGDEETDFAIEFIYSHTITDDGSLYIDSEVLVHVNEKKVPLPEERPANLSVMPEGELIASDQESMENFNSLFDPNEIALLREIGKTVLQETDPTDIVKGVYHEIESMRFMTQVDRVKSMRAIAARLFPELLQEDF